MSPIRLVGIGLIVAGVAALMYRGYTYTRHHDVDIGFFDLSYDDHETVFIPAWVGVVSIGAGTVLLVTRRGG